jgi:molybdate transport system regulatory protein
MNGSKEDTERRVRNRIWLEGADGTYLGEGRIQLLRTIRETGSIRASAKVMGMSYKKAWRSVASMNRNAPSPLVQKETGGSRGGGTVLTEEGEEAIRAFEGLKKDCEEFLRKRAKEHGF